MKKRVVILAIAVLLVVPASLFSVDLIGLRVGPTAMLNAPINPEQFPTDLLINIENYSFGVDARFNLTVLEVNALALIEPQVDEFGTTGVLVTMNAGAGVSIPLADIVQLGVFAGPELNFAITESGFIPGEDFPVQAEDLFASNLFLRLTADALLGDLSIGGTYIINTNTNLNDILNGTFDTSSVLDNLNGRVGISVLFSLF